MLNKAKILRSMPRSRPSKLKNKKYQMMVDNDNIQFYFYRPVLINFFSYDYLLQMLSLIHI